MIQWGEEKRSKDPGYFCRIITAGPGSEKTVWVVSDARRKTDIAWFKDHYGKQVVTVRVQAEDSIRKQRGWAFTQGIHTSDDFHQILGGFVLPCMIMRLMVDVYFWTPPFVTPMVFHYIL